MRLAILWCDVQCYLVVFRRQSPWRHKPALCLLSTDVSDCLIKLLIKCENETNESQKARMPQEDNID